MKIRQHIACFIVCILTVSCGKQSDDAGSNFPKISLAGASSTSQYDGPFGVARAEPLSALDHPEEKSPGVYLVKSVPQPYAGIDIYLVQNTPEHGTCMVKAVSGNIHSDSFGNSLKSAVDKVRDDIERRYGKPSNSFDFLQAGSIWDDHQDWMMGLSEKERTYSYYWTAPKTRDEKIWRKVETIGLAAASDGKVGWFTIEYDFVNNKQCDEDLKTKAARNL